MLKQILTILRITQRILGLTLDIVSAAVLALRQLASHNAPTAAA